MFVCVSVSCRGRRHTIGIVWSNKTLCCVALCCRLLYSSLCTLPSAKVEVWVARSTTYMLLFLSLVTLKDLVCTENVQLSCAIFNGCVVFIYLNNNSKVKGSLVS